MAGAMGATRRRRGPSKGKRLPALRLKRKDHDLFLFYAKASVLYDMLSINRRAEDKDEGYQRALSESRVKAIADYLSKGKIIPTSILVSFDDGARFDDRSNTLIIPPGDNVGWVIDGQHRLAGAYQAAEGGHDVELAAVGFIGLSMTDQIEQFVVINREAKGVPTSLYLDLLGKLPTKRPQDVARERAADIAMQLRRDEESIFFERIVVTRTPKRGELSLTNFVRKVSPLIMEGRIFHVYYEKEQRAIIENYYKALRIVFTKSFDKPDSIFFKTVGFGGLVNALPLFFSYCFKQHGGFRVDDAVQVFRKIDTFDFEGWRKIGSGSAAEIQAGEDLKVAIGLALREFGETTGTLRV